MPSGASPWLLREVSDRLRQRDDVGGCLRGSGTSPAKGQRVDRGSTRNGVLLDHAERCLRAQRELGQILAMAEIHRVAHRLRLRQRGGDAESAIVCNQVIDMLTA